MYARHNGCGKLAASDLWAGTSADMLSVARNYQLRLTLRQGENPKVIFEGFKKEVSRAASVGDFHAADAYRT